MEFSALECFLLTDDLNAIVLNLELTVSPINCRFFLKRFPVYFNLFVLLFRVTSCLVVAGLFNNLAWSEDQSERERESQKKKKHQINYSYHSTAFISLDLTIQIQF